MSAETEPDEAAAMRRVMGSLKASAMSDKGETPAVQTSRPGPAPSATKRATETPLVLLPVLDEPAAEVFDDYPLRQEHHLPAASVPRTNGTRRRLVGCVKAALLGLACGALVVLVRPYLPSVLQGPLATSALVAETSDRLRIVIHHSESSGPGAAEALAATLTDAGYPPPELRAVAAPISRPSARYYHAADREMLLRLAALAEAAGTPLEVRDLPEAAPAPAPGSLDIWLKG